MDDTAAIAVLTKHGFQWADMGLYERGPLSGMLLISGNVKVFRGERAVPDGYCETPEQLDAVLARALAEEAR